VIDLHCHLLPQLDDGPADLTEALQMCRRAVADGITHAITTPHIHPGRWDNNAASISSAVAQLRHSLSAQDIPLQLGFAGEVRLSDQLPGQVQRGEIPFYGEHEGYRVMLLEFPHGHIPPGSDKLAGWLLDQGIRPLIAHPERNKQVMKSVQGIYPFVEMGCWLQVTAGSITGAFGEPAQEVSRHLLHKDIVAVVASAGHNTGARPPALGAAYKVLAEDYGELRARRLICDTPGALVAQQFPNSGEFSTMAAGH